MTPNPVRVPDHLLQQLLDWSRGYLKQRDARSATAGDARAVELWGHITSALAELQRIRRRAEAENGCVDLLAKTLERLETLNDPAKEASHAAVTAELLLSQINIREALRRLKQERNA